MSTLGKAAVVLRAFTAAQPEWGSRPLAAHLGLPRATTHFYLSGLAEAGFGPADEDALRRVLLLCIRGLRP